MQPAPPPRTLERLVRALLGDTPSAPFIVGDLREEFRALAAGRPRSLLCLWYLAQGVRLSLRFRLERLRTARTSPGGPPPAGARPPSHGDAMSADLRQSIRSLKRRPGLSGSIVLTVALAVAATTAAFAVVDGVLLEPLPYASPERLVAVWEANPRGVDRNVVSPANYLTWRDELESLDALASMLETSTTLVEGGTPERVGIVQAGADYFEMIGAEAIVGRLYGPSDDVEGAAPVAVLMEGFWRRRFGADPSMVGATLQLGVRGGGAYTVVGVLQDRFDFEVELASAGGIGSHDVWVPPAFPAAARDAGGRYLQVVGRLAPGATIENARQEASALAARLAEAFPDRQRGWGVNVFGLHGDLVGDARTTILVIFGAVLLVLLIACANVANLLMTRASERQQEMAVRSALGAGRGRLVGQLLVESAVLSVLGGLLGVVLAERVLAALVRSAPDLPRIDTIGMDASVIAFALLATCGTALLFGLAPALSLAGPELSSWLGARSGGARRETRRLRGVLVVAQVALSLVLLVGAGLLVRSLVNRLDVGVGFDVENLLVAEVQLVDPRYQGEAAMFFEQLVDRVAELPGVSAASAITWPPLAGGGSRTSFWPLDRPVPPAGELPGADVRWVHRDYHRVLGIPVLSGRGFGPDDRPEAPLVVLVNETGAERIWPGENPLGKRIAMEWGDTLVAEVVGVVGDIRHDGPDTEPYPMFYWEHRQFLAFSMMSLVVRTAGASPETVVAGIRGELSELDPGVPLYNIRPMEELFGDALRRARFATLSLGLFAALALVLAAIGIYGVMAHQAARRTREIGVRMALGAGRSSILGMVVREGMTQVGLAIVIGTAGALALARVLEGLVFGVGTADPLTFAGTAGLLALTGLAACWLPARRASAIDPAETIRSE